MFDIWDEYDMMVDHYFESYDGNVDRMLADIELEDELDELEDSIFELDDEDLDLDEFEGNTLEEILEFVKWALE